MEANLFRADMEKGRGTEGRGRVGEQGSQGWGGGGAEGRGLRRTRRLEAAAGGGGRRLRSAGERHDGSEGVRGDPLSHQLPRFQLFLCGLHLPQSIPIPTPLQIYQFTAVVLT